MRLTAEAKLIYFVDFDGTITKEDTCTAMAKAFAVQGWEKFEERWEKGELTTEECAQSIFNLYNATEDDWRNLIDCIAIDDKFLDFVAYCKSRDEKVYILSDGYDLNIAHILSRIGLSDLPFYSNCLRITENKFSMQCPHQDPLCSKCGTCKKSLLKKIRHDKEIVVYIGDGTSDICVAIEADILFAKDKLLQYCQRKGLYAIPYQSFSDVVTELQGLFK